MSDLLDLEFKRHIGWDFVIDANRINARGKLPHMCQLEKWGRDGVTRIVISNEASEEASRGNTARRDKAADHINTVTHVRAPDEIQLLKAIVDVLSSGGTKKTNDEIDARIVFNAAKYLDILITNDGASNSQPGGILGHRDKLRSLHPSIKIMSDLEAVSFVRERIKQRDDQIRLIVEAFPSATTPSWVGQD